MPTESLDDAALILYGLTTDEFVEARNTLEKDVRKAGDRELARQIRTLRKPSVIAAGLNAIVRKNPGAVDHLLSAVADLRDAQEQIASGRESDFATLQTRYRQALQALVDQAEEARRIEVQAALETAATDPGFDQLLRTGTFAAAPKPTGSFGITLPAAVPVAREERPAKGRTPKPTAPAEPIPDLRLVRAARRKAEAARERKTRAEGELVDARETLQGLDERIARLEADIAEARLDRRKTQKRVSTAEKEATNSAAQLAKAQAALKQTKST